MKIKNFIEWTEELSVGIQEIDEQHKVLVSIINRLYETIIKQTDREEIGYIMNELAQYTVVHFAVEESLMRIFDYPNYEEHKQHHEELTNQVIQLTEKVQHGKFSSSMELLSFLKNWLTRHILIEDKKYSTFFLERGLKRSWAKQSWAGRIWQAVHHR